MKRKTKSDGDPNTTLFPSFERILKTVYILSKYVYTTTYSRSAHVVIVNFRYVYYNERSCS